MVRFDANDNQEFVQSVQFTNVRRVLENSLLTCRDALVQSYLDASSAQSAESAFRFNFWVRLRGMRELLLKNAAMLSLHDDKDAILQLVSLATHMRSIRENLRVACGSLYEVIWPPLGARPMTPLGLPLAQAVNLLVAGDPRTLAAQTHSVVARAGLLSENVLQEHEVSDKFLVLTNQRLSAMLSSSFALLKARARHVEVSRHLRFSVRMSRFRLFSPDEFDLSVVSNLRVFRVESFKVLVGVADCAAHCFRDARQQRCACAYPYQLGAACTNTLQSSVNIVSEAIEFLQNAVHLELNAYKAGANALKEVRGQLRDLLLLSQPTAPVAPRAPQTRPAPPQGPSPAEPQSAPDAQATVREKAQAPPEPSQAIQSKPEPEPEPELETKSKSVPKPEAELESKPELELEAELEAELEPELEQFVAHFDIEAFRQLGTAAADAAARAPTSARAAFASLAARASQLTASQFHALLRRLYARLQTQELAYVQHAQRVKADLAQLGNLELLKEFYLFFQLWAYRCARLALVLILHRQAQIAARSLVPQGGIVHVTLLKVEQDRNELASPEQSLLRELFQRYLPQAFERWATQSSAPNSTPFAYLLGRRVLPTHNDVLTIDCLPAYPLRLLCALCDVQTPLKIPQLQFVLRNETAHFSFCARPLDELVRSPFVERAALRGLQEFAFFFRDAPDAATPNSTNELAVAQLGVRLSVFIDRMISFLADFALYCIAKAISSALAVAHTAVRRANTTQIILCDALEVTLQVNRLTGALEHEVWATSDGGKTRTTYSQSLKHKLLHGDLSDYCAQLQDVAAALGAKRAKRCTAS